MIRKIKSYTEFIMENKNNKYDYGCVMLDLDVDKIGDKAKEIIDKDDIYLDENGGKGLEDNYHCTILYGLHSDVDETTVTKIVKEFKYTDVIIHNCSLFENDEFDVLKFDVKYANESDSFLHDCNEKLRKLPHTNSFPDYHPHVTIGYLKSGVGKKYTDKFNESYTVKPKNVIYSKADKTKIKIELTNENA